MHDIAVCSRPMSSEMQIQNGIEEHWQPAMREYLFWPKPFSARGSGCWLCILQYVSTLVVVLLEVVQWNTVSRTHVTLSHW